MESWKTPEALEEALLGIISEKEIVHKRIFDQIENYNCRVSKELYDTIRRRYIESYLSELEFLEEAAHVAHLKDRLREFSASYDELLQFYDVIFDVTKLEYLKKNVVAALEQEIRLREGLQSENLAKGGSLAKIRINKRKVDLYAIFKELSKEMFPNISDHRLSQLISENFEGDDGSSIDQKTCYNQLRGALAPEAKERLQEMVRRISQRLK